jgi:hypothetical protein
MVQLRWISGLVLGLVVALGIAAPGGAAPPVPSLEGTWLAGAGEGSAGALLTCRADGTVAVVVPDGTLVLPDGSRWPVAPVGYGTWRARRFPEAELTAVFLVTGPAGAATAGVRLDVRVTLDVTGQGWRGGVRLAPLDRAGRAVGDGMEMGTVEAARVLYGR